MVKFTADFKYVESWVLPKSILDKFESMGNSGGSWGPDGYLYCLNICAVDGTPGEG